MYLVIILLIAIALYCILWSIFLCGDTKVGGRSKQQKRKKRIKKYRNFKAKKRTSKPKPHCTPVQSELSVNAIPESISAIVVVKKRTRKRVRRKAQRRDKVTRRSNRLTEEEWSVIFEQSVKLPKRLAELTKFLSRGIISHIFDNFASLDPQLLVIFPQVCKLFATSSTFSQTMEPHRLILRWLPREVRRLIYDTTSQGDQLRELWPQVCFEFAVSSRYDMELNFHGDFLIKNRYKTIHCTFVHGVLHGQYNSYYKRGRPYRSLKYDNGVIVDGTYRDDIYAGYKEYTIKNGVYHGVCTTVSTEFHYEKRTVPYVCGNKEGMAVVEYKFGCGLEEKSYGMYKNNKEIGIWVYNECVTPSRFVKSSTEHVTFLEDGLCERIQTRDKSILYEPPIDEYMLPSLKNFQIINAWKGICFVDTKKDGYDFKATFDVRDHEAVVYKQTVKVDGVDVLHRLCNMIVVGDKLVKHGRDEKFYVNGNRKYRCHWLYGISHGHTTRWESDGTISYRRDFILGFEALFFCCQADYSYCRKSLEEEMELNYTS